MIAAAARLRGGLGRLYLKRWVEPRAGFIVSHPKCGRTWVAVMLASVFSRITGRPFTLDLYQYGGWRRGLPYILFTHDGAGTARVLHHDKGAFRRRAVLLLVRDPRDVLVSHYFQVTKRQRLFAGDLDAFIRDPVYGVDWLIDYMNAWAASRDLPRRFTVLSYEACQEDPGRALRTLLEFFRVEPVPDEVIAGAVEAGAFENMRRLERENRLEDYRLRPGDLADPESYKVRRGRVGGYVDYLTPEQLAYVDERLRARLSPLFAAYVR
jgi:hypothetical protein